MSGPAPTGTDAAAATTEPRRGRLSRARLVPLTSAAGLILVLVAAAVLAPEFYSSANLANVARQASILAVIAIGQTFVLLVAGIDLSVGAVMGIAMIVAAQVTGGRNGPLFGAIVLALAIGVGIGLVNAVLVVGRRVPPFVATLAMLILLEGGRLAWTRGIPSGSIPPTLHQIGAGRVGPVPIPLLVMVLIAAAGMFVLQRTTYGRAVYATGLNPRAAAMSGLPTGMITASAYVISAVLAIVGGLLLSGYIGYVDRYLGQGFDLDSIAAAVVGGTSLAGGRGSVAGTLLGVALVAVLLNVVVLLEAGVGLQSMIKGLVIVAAVAVQTRTRSAQGAAA
jgi:ribose transport system permease protein